MSSKIQSKLDQETLSPVMAIFLMLLLQMAGLLEREEEEEPEKLTGFIEYSNNEPDECGEVLSSNAITDYVSALEDYRRSAIYHEQPVMNTATLNIPGAVLDLQMPDGARHCNVDMATRTIQWVHSHGRVSPAEDLDKYLQRIDYTHAPDGMAFYGSYGSSLSVGQCTPHRGLPLTVSDWPRTLEGEWITD